MLADETADEVRVVLCIGTHEILQTCQRQRSKHDTATPPLLSEVHFAATLRFHRILQTTTRPEPLRLEVIIHSNLALLPH